MALEFLKLWFTEASQWGRRSDALQSLRWLCLIVTTPALVLATRTQGSAQTWLFLFADGPVALFGFAYIYFMFRDPDRLQSEQYLLRDRAFDLIESKGGPIKLSEEGVHKIANPYLEQRKLRALTPEGSRHP